MFLGHMAQSLEKQAGGISWKHILGLAPARTAQTGRDVLNRILAGLGGGAGAGSLLGGTGAVVGARIGAGRGSRAGFDAMREAVGASTPAGQATGDLLLGIPGSIVGAVGGGVQGGIRGAAAGGIPGVAAGAIGGERLANALINKRLMAEIAKRRKQLALVGSGIGGLGLLGGGAVRAMDSQA